MKTIKITVNNKEYLFICNWRNTRTGFAHDCNLLIDGIEKSVSHCFYINRTWEVYSFQSVAVEAVDLLIKDREETIKTEYMESHGFKRLTQKRAGGYFDELATDSTITDLKAVKSKLLHNIY